MLSRFLVVSLSIFLTGFVFGQLPAKVKKLAGTWNFKEGGGYEVWELRDDEMIGSSYRISTVGDTSKVEDFELKKLNKSLVLNISTFTNSGDSVVVNKHSFVGGKRKMEFVNLDEPEPYSIDFKIGFFNRNKLKITVTYFRHEEPLRFTLFKTKE
jgi:hypothetical protein